ncbi:helix-turn-helix domain-containing protein [Actinoallomurus purpureus]|uniref:helix-turn-helix domain-containing protein n=1 Tax=Actinoallomurus purpureus TaxID=478114 RepID=UPI002093477D|nr:helix-turn-helix domain-containing protein [Actinoallomurus purpureus]MCO6005337.1 helix-turn-helix domain-containing protein [Actinoallomurus purpureus]
MGLPAASPEMAVPAVADYREQVTWQSLDDLLIVRRVSGAHSAHFSRPSLEGGWADFMAVFQVTAGSVHITDAENDVVIGPGMVSIRDFGNDWRYSSGEETTSRILIFPKQALSEVSHERLIPFVAVESSSPEARLLLAQLDALGETAGTLTCKAAKRARNATLHLIRGILDAELSSEARSSHMRSRAERYIDRNLRDPSLDPNTIAKDLGVSLRTLHRTFAESDESVMAYVRRQRLDHARIEMSTQDSSVTIAYLAARWQFSDAAHFSRAFRQRFGLTPTQYRKRGQNTRLRA